MSMHDPKFKKQLKGEDSDSDFFNDEDRDEFLDNMLFESEAFKRQKSKVFREHNKTAIKANLSINSANVER